MNKNIKLRPFPADFADRFPDGSYAIGRGADPCGSSGRVGAPLHQRPVESAKVRKAAAKNRPAKSSAD